MAFALERGGCFDALSIEGRTSGSDVGENNLSDSGSLNGRNALISLVGDDSVDSIRQAINSGVYLHLGIERGFTVLQWASIIGKVDVVEIFLKNVSYSKDAYDDFNMSYIYALKYGQKSVLEIMDETQLGYGDSIDKLVDIVKDLELLQKKYEYNKSIGNGSSLSIIQNTISKSEGTKMWLLSKMPGYYIEGEYLYFKSEQYDRGVGVRLPSLYDGTTEDNLQLSFIDAMIVH